MNIAKQNEMFPNNLEFKVQLKKKKNEGKRRKKPRELLTLEEKLDKDHGALLH